MSNKTKLAVIVAAAENDVIGNNDDLPWRLSADLKRFKSLTMGHHIIMGRKTFDSIGRLLPGRTTIIVTRNADFKFAGAKIAHSVDAAIEACCEEQMAFLIGGAEIYRLALPRVDELFLTRVHAHVDGDTTLPEIDWGQWELVSDKHHSADEKTNMHFRFCTTADVICRNKDKPSVVLLEAETFDLLRPGTQFQPGTARTNRSREA